MELRGKVNCYEPYRWHGGIGAEVYTINLATGVTPFCNFLNGKEYISMCYRLRNPTLVSVKRGWYRPKPDEFNILSHAVQDHILNGGLLDEELAVAASRQLVDDPVNADWDYEQFQEWCLKTYGKRRCPLEI